MASAKVLICGKTSSGNRLVQSLLQAAGAETFIWHGERSERPENCPYERVVRKKPWTHMVQPVRDPLFREASHARVRPNWPEPVWDREEFAKDLGIPLLEVPYRSIVEQPDEARTKILEFCGLPNTRWPAPIYDADEKYRRRMLAR